MQHRAPSAQPARARLLAASGLLGAVWVLAAIPLLQGLSAANVAIALGIMAASTLSWWLHQRALAAAHHPHQLDAPLTARRHWRDFLGKLLPVWRRQADTVRLQTEDATSTLLSNLSALLTRFDSSDMGKAARHSEALTTQELLRQCEDKLTPVISTMTGMAASKDDMAQRMQALGSTAAELHNLVDDVAKLAQQTNLLSLNAAIEAARAGEHGRGFGVVATEVRRLSMDSAKTAGRIRERIGEISQIMTEAGETAVKTAQQEEQAIQRTSHMVQEVVAHVHQLGTNAEQLAAESHEILRNVESLIMGLQFQDRVSQAVDILNRDILKLETLLPEVQDVPDADAWLQALHEQYTMKEQRLRHTEDVSNVQSDPAQRAAIFF